MISPRRILTQRILLLAAPLSLFLVLPSAHAQIVIYKGSDPTAGPGQADPNTAAARALFVAAASGFGPSTLINFESSALGSTTFTAANNTVQISGTNNSHGVRSSGSQTLGYNTTTGGSQYLQLYSTDGSNAVTETFNFIGSSPFTTGAPITAFGANFTGVGTDTGTTTITFSDGSKETEALPGSSLGGVQFFGFTDTKGLAIKSVTLGVFPVKGGTTNDVIGIDDVLLYSKVPGSPAPEPSQSAVFSLGLVLLGGSIAAARKRRTARLA